MNWLQGGLLDLGRYEESDAILKQLLVTDPLNIIGRLNYIERLSQTGRVEEAHELADELLAQSPMWAYSAHAGTSLVYEGKIAEGLSWSLKLGRELGRGSGYAMFVFIWVGEYDEARRFNARNAFWIDVAEGHWDEAIRATQRNMHLDPDNRDEIVVAANVLYSAGRIDEALPLFEHALTFEPEGRPMSVRLSHFHTMMLALARRKAGDEDGAQAAAQLVRQDHAARRAAGMKNPDQDVAEALIAAFERNPDRVIDALKSAIQLGLRDLQVFDDLIFEDLWDEPRFVALQKKLDTILDVEHDKVLQLICFNNPTPDDWHPLPETCEGVVKQRLL